MTTTPARTHHLYWQSETGQDELDCGSYSSATRAAEDEAMADLLAQCGGGVEGDQQREDLRAGRFVWTRD